MSINLSVLRWYQLDFCMCSNSLPACLLICCNHDYCVHETWVKKFRFFIHLRYTCVSTKQGVLAGRVLWGRGLGGASVLGEGSVFTQNTRDNTLKNSRKHSYQTKPKGQSAGRDKSVFSMDDAWFTYLLLFNPLICFTKLLSTGNLDQDLIT